MFCMNCGKEIPNEARFCQHCGTGTNMAANPSPHPGSVPEAIAGPVVAVGTPTLTDYHTLDWRGECPSCKLVHTPKNCMCSNDGSPVVVAFHGESRARASYYPIHAAELRCLNDCGVRVGGFPCTNCGTLITGRYIKFRFPTSHVVFHKLYYYFLRLVFLASLATCVGSGYTLYSDYRLWRNANRLQLAVGLPADVTPEGLYPYANHRFYAAIISFIVLIIVRGLLRSYRAKTWFDFTDVNRAAKAHAKQEALNDAIVTAKATAAATRPFKLGDV